eukprot:GHRQ01032337.1.p1 GENE.GHRQ01032337.1~~GHRQ01032337.1.p1  ORF type:complete len:124 (+),score=38.02 GHRQ01032337.1:42-413(+)
MVCWRPAEAATAAVACALLQVPPLVPCDGTPATACFQCTPLLRYAVKSMVFPTLCSCCVPGHADIICQKVATEGLTRFEDRHRLPLGISVNLNSFSAKTLAQVRHSGGSASCVLQLLHASCSA